MLSSGSKSGEGIATINVVPLIDVSLVLVVILMLLTPLAFESSLAVHRAEAASRAAARSEATERVEVLILSEAEVRVNRTNVARADLSQALVPLLSGAVPPPVVVSCAEGVSHGTFVGVLDQARLCGAQELAVTEATN